MASRLENMLQPGGMQVDESSSHDFGFLDATSPNEGMNNHGTNAFVFEKTLGMNNSELLWLMQWILQLKIMELLFQQTLSQSRILRTGLPHLLSVNCRQQNLLAL